MRTRSRQVALIAGLLAAYVVGTYSGVVVSNAGDCVQAPPPSGADDTTALNEWIVSIPDGGCGFVKPRKDGNRRVYHTERTVTVDHKSDVTLELAAATFRASSLVGNLGIPGGKVVWRPHFKVAFSVNVTVRGLRVEGAGTGTFNKLYEGEAGFLIDDSTGALLAVSTYGTGGDGLEISGTTGLLVDQSVFEFTGRQGVATVEGSSGLIVQNTTIRDVPRAAFDIEPVAARFHVTDTHFVYNTIVNHGLLTLAAGGGGTKDGVEFAFNTDAQPIRIKYIGSGLTVRGNVGAGIATSPIVQPFGGSGLVVEDNVQIFKPPQDRQVGSYAIAPIDWCEATASGNDFTGSRGLYEGTPNAGCTWAAA